VSVLAPVSELVGHLRWRIGPPEADDLLGAALAADPTALAAVVDATGPGRGSDDPQVVASLWWQAYAYRVAGTTLAAWVLAGAAPDPSAPGAGVGVARSRPSSLLVDPAAADIDDLDGLVAATFAGHLDGVAEALRQGRHLGASLVWGNVAGGVTSALGAVATAPGAPPVADRIGAVLAALPHGIGDLGTWTLEPFGFRRRTCCLWWKTTVSGGALCEDCSLGPRP
jgi:ferric iron reductase protein FhuF